MIYWVHEDPRLQIAAAGRPGAIASQGGGRRVGRDDEGASSAVVRGDSPGRWRLDGTVRGRGRASAEGAAARTTARDREAAAVAGGADGAGGRGSLPGAIEAAVLALDARGGRRIDPEAVWGEAFRLDGRK